MMTRLSPLILALLTSVLVTGAAIAQGIVPTVSVQGVANGTPAPVIVTGTANAQINGPLGATTTPGNAIANVSPDGLTATGNATAPMTNVWGNGAYSFLSTLGFNTLHFDIRGSSVSPSANVQGCEGDPANPTANCDPSTGNWVNVYATGTSAGGCTNLFTSTSGQFVIFNPPAMVRMNLTAISSGTYTSTYSLRSSTGATVYNCNSGTTQVDHFGTANNSFISTFSAVAPATPAAVQVKGSAGRLFHLNIGNSGSSDVWVKVYNAASVSLGTTPATLNFYIPKGTSQSVSLGDIGFYLSTAIQYAVTGGISLIDNTSITASTVTINGSYE